VPRGEDRTSCYNAFELSVSFFFKLSKCIPFFYIIRSICYPFVIKLDSPVESGCILAKEC